MKNWRRTVTASWIAQFLCIVGFSVSTPFLPFYIQTLGVTELRDVELWSGLLNSAGAISMALVSPLWGALSDRRGRRLMVERATFGGAISIALMVFATNVQQVLILRAIQGMLTGTVAAFITLVVGVSPEDRVTQNLGLMQIAVYAGSSVGPMVGGLVAGWWGYRVAFWVTSGMLLIAGVMVHFLVEDAPIPATGARREDTGLRPALRSLLKSAPLLAALSVMFFAYIASSNIQPILPLFVQSVGASDKTAASATGLVLGAAALASSISAALIGRATHRLGERLALVACTLGAGLAYFPQMFARSVSALVAGQFASGLFVGGTLPLANAVIARLTPRHQQGATYGLCTSLQSAARAIGPMLGSGIALSLGMGAVFGLTGVLYVVAAAGVFFAIRTGSRAITPLEPSETVEVLPPQPDRADRPGR